VTFINIHTTYIIISCIILIILLCIIFFYWSSAWQLWPLAIVGVTIVTVVTEHLGHWEVFFLIVGEGTVGFGKHVCLFGFGRISNCHPY